MNWQSRHGRRYGECDVGDSFLIQSVRCAFLLPLGEVEQIIRFVGLVFPHQVRLLKRFLIQFHHLLPQACDGAIERDCGGFLRSQVSLRPGHILAQKFVGGIAIGGLIYVLRLFRFFDGVLGLLDLLVNLLHQRIARVILHQQLAAIDLRGKEVALQLLQQQIRRI